MQSNRSLTRLQASKLHVGIIMDGNGRWAKRRHLPRLRGHEAGIEAIRRVVEAAPEQGVGTLTLYAFSSDNWRRPQAEVTALMGLLRFYLANEIESLVQERRAPHRDRPPRPAARRHCRRDRAAPKTRPRTATRSICASPSTIPRATPFSTRRYSAAGMTRAHARDVFAARHRRSRMSRRRSRHPHQRREAAVGLPALGKRLCRILFHRTHVAGFRGRRSCRAL